MLGTGLPFCCCVIYLELLYIAIVVEMIDATAWVWFVGLTFIGDMWHFAKVATTSTLPASHVDAPERQDARRGPWQRGSRFGSVSAY